MRFSRAIVRLPGHSYATGLTTSSAQGPPDRQRALAQHAAYCDALRASGLAVTVLDADERHPDGTFVEDTALLTERVAVTTRPGAPTRAGEVAAVAGALQKFRLQLETIVAPGTLDGGDVCQVEEHFLIGVSARTNEEGARQLASILARHGYSSALLDIRANRGLLHLKTGIAYIGEHRLVTTADAPHIEGLADYERIVVDAAEAYAANCVRINDVVLVAAGYKNVTARLEKLGCVLRVLEMSEFRKMDGGLSCLSLRF